MPQAITIQISPPDAGRRTVLYAGFVGSATIQTAHAMAKDAVDRLSRAAPVGHGQTISGRGPGSSVVSRSASYIHLRDSFDYDVRAAAMGILGPSIDIVVTTNRPYFKYVVGGRGPIIPQKSAWLRFVGYERSGNGSTANGRIVFSRGVGPQAPNDFVGRTAMPAIETDLTVLTEALATELDAAWGSELRLGGFRGNRPNRLALITSRRPPITSRFSAG